MKLFFKKHADEIILFLGVILVSLLSFAMGYIVAKLQDKEPIKIEQSRVDTISGQVYNKLVNL
jgi:hypothetical protein